MGTSADLEVGNRRLTLSNLDKVFFPKAGFSKADLIDYYIKVGDFILPHLANRPHTLKRYPDGVQGEHFYEKNAPAHTPAWAKTFKVDRKGGGEAIRYVLINDLPTLIWAANLASIEMHVFLATVPHIERPKAVVFDLDPGAPANVLQCGEVALQLKRMLDKLGLDSLIKFSGSKGLQLYIPLNVPITYEVTQAFAKTVAELLEQQAPDLVTSRMAKELRPGKVFIDWSQNSEFKTTVCVYSLRAKRDLPFVSFPFTWPELKSALKSGNISKFDITPDEAIRKLKRKGDIFSSVLKLKQKLPARFAQVTKTLSTKTPPSPRKGSLAEYDRKRNFSQTAEPPPQLKGNEGPARLFVIQKHQASHLHYDFRLEMDGVLKSWAVPKGPPWIRAEKRLAMEVEDHPMDYARFEGTIPPGNYGAGTVMVWDIGTYEIIDGSYRQGKLHLLLKGKKLKGEWILVRAKSDQTKQPWFLIKGGDDAKPPGAKKLDVSVLTGRSLDRITADNDAQWASNR